ncbi:MAG: hypothetical protein O2972_02865, partial [Cyanobacteria bacterium]|nr:hypothetical protein [Cyanobacteriota bacterium]
GIIKIDAVPKIAASNIFRSENLNIFKLYRIHLKRNLTSKGPGSSLFELDMPVHLGLSLR